MKLSRVALLFVSLVACKGPGTAASAPIASSVAPSVAQIDTTNQSGPSFAARTHGVPHSINIDMVALSSDGAMAMSRDSGGGLRYWSALDGSAQPALVPIRGARSFTLARAEGGASLAVIDAIGALHILRADAEGNMTELYMSSPHTPIRQAAVLRGGERVVTLSQDHILALRELSGKVLSSVQERRFRPSDFRITRGGTEVATLSGEPGPLGLSVTLRRVRVDLDTDSLQLADEELEVEGVLGLEEPRFSISPDGKGLAFLGLAPAPAAEAPAPAPGASAPVAVGPPSPPVAPPPPAGTTLIVWDLQSESGRGVELNLLQHEIGQVGLGFVNDSTIVLSSRPSGSTWRVVLGKEIASYSLRSSVAQDTQHSAHDFAKGVHLAADGTWLYVQNAETDEHHYLGYTPFDPQHASMAPGGDHVAWTTAQMIYVESLTGPSKSFRISAMPTEAYFRAGFVDDEHLVAIDYSGGLHLIDWRSGKELGAIDTGGAVREFEVDQERKLIRGVRQTGGSWLCELKENEIVGPYLIQDQGYRSGFLTGKDALWTIDAKLRYHTYSLAALRSGLSAKALHADSPVVTGTAPNAIDSRGRRYLAKAENNAATLLVTDAEGNEVHSLPLPFTPLQVHPSPDASMLALVAPSGAIVEVFDVQTGKSLWSMSIVQGIRHVAWSMDSTRLALASQLGAVVVAAKSGEQLRLGCGPWFEKRSTPPVSTLSFVQVPNLCEI